MFKIKKPKPIRTTASPKKARGVAESAASQALAQSADRKLPHRHGARSANPPLTQFPTDDR